MKALWRLQCHVASLPHISGVKHEQAIKSFEISCPAGGNQRELARQKNAKKQNETTKGKRNEDGLSAAARKQRDAEIMQQKQKKANEKGDPKAK
ncbi:hypothetical protein ABG768_024995 [Culter alburnus]|uniref:Small EDRK-rich factor-like N-terminal domain-containing protein n=1 Tax=Culter alburnus TaxID=194366 RepID=A0AAW2AE03_CULAL